MLHLTILAHGRIVEESCEDSFFWVTEFGVNLGFGLLAYFSYSSWHTYDFLHMDLKLIAIVYVSQSDTNFCAG